LFVLAIGVYAVYGFQGELRFDQGLYTYAAQQMVQGVPFYASTFDAKTPLTVFILAAGMWAGNRVGVDDLLAARATNLLIAGLCVVAVYALGQALFRSRRVGLFAALSFLTFYTFGSYAASGPRDKTFLVLAVAVSLWLGARRRWFWAGLAGALAALTWQPAALIPLVMAVLAVLQTDAPAARRLRSGLAVLAGVLLPLAAVVVYFALVGALRLAYEGSVLFNLKYIDRGPVSPLQHFVNPIHWTLTGYPGQWIILVLGGVMLLALWAERLEAAGSFGQFVAADRFAGLLILSPLFALWSLRDFGSPTDLYFLLPSFAVGFGWLLALAAQAVSATVLRRHWQNNAFVAMLCLALIATAVGPLYHQREVKLPAERANAQRVEQLLGPAGVLLTISAPELLVLTHRANPTRFLYMVFGTPRYLEASEPGGLAGWLQRMQALHPRVVATGTGPNHVDSIPRPVAEWLAAEYDRRSIGIWDVYVAKGK